MGTFYLWCVFGAGTLFAVRAAVTLIGLGVIEMDLDVGGESAVNGATPFVSRLSLQWLPFVLIATPCLQVVAESTDKDTQQKRHRILTSVVLDAVFDEQVTGDNIRQVLKHAATLPVAERFRYLSEYVLPGEDHLRFRVTGEFIGPGADVAVSPRDELVIEDVEQLLSPVYALLDVAVATGKLHALREGVVAVRAADGEFQ